MPVRVRSSTSGGSERRCLNAAGSQSTRLAGLFPETGVAAGIASLAFPASGA